jgi:hypothetical protein
MDLRGKTQLYSTQWTQSWPEWAEFQLVQQEIAVSSSSMSEAKAIIASIMSL